MASNKNTSTRLDSFRMMAEEPGDDQAHFRISDSDKDLSEQLIRYT